MSVTTASACEQAEKLLSVTRAPLSPAERMRRMRERRRGAGAAMMTSRQFIDFLERKLV